MIQNRNTTGYERCRAPTACPARRQYIIAQPKPGGRTHFAEYPAHQAQPARQGRHPAVPPDTPPALDPPSRRRPAAGHARLIAPSFAGETDLRFNRMTLCLRQPAGAKGQLLRSPVKGPRCVVVSLETRPGDRAAPGSGGAGCDRLAGGGLAARLGFRAGHGRAVRVHRLCCPIAGLPQRICRCPLAHRRRPLLTAHRCPEGSSDAFCQRRCSARQRPPGSL